MMPLRPSFPHLSLPVGIGILLIIAGCASSSGGGNAEGGSGGDTKSTLSDIGADIGCGIATLIRKDCARGAEVGITVVDKAISWVFRSLKIADAKTVNNEYKERRIPVAKESVTPMAFKTDVKTSEESNVDSETQKKTQSLEVRVTSTSDLVGYGDQVPKVTQHYALYDEKNKLVSSKTEQVAAVDGAGRYETDAKFKVPNATAKKRYRVETTLVVDGKTYKKNTYKVTLDESGLPTVAALEPAPPVLQLAALR